MSSSSIVSTLFNGRFSLLLLSLLLLFLIGPLIPGNQSVVDQILGALNLIVLVGCLRAISRTRRFFILMLGFTFINIVFGGIDLTLSISSIFFQRVMMLSQILYYMMMFVGIMRYVMDSTYVTMDKIFGAVCAYMIMGLAWAWVYIFFYHVDCGCFKIPELLLSTESLMSSWAVYFSFTTMTALGYGDITPLNPAVQSYAIMQAAAGQLFVAVILGRLIALQIAHSGADALKRKSTR